MKREKDDIERYRNGSMTEAERYAMEKKALGDPFLSDALEGAEQIDADDFSKGLDSIERKIQKNKFGFTPLRIAAGVLILMTTGVLLYFINLPEPQQLALEKSAAGPNSTEQADSVSLLSSDDKDIQKEEEQPAIKPKAKSLALAEDKQRKADGKPAPGNSQPEIKTEKESVTPGSTREKDVKEEIAEEKVAAVDPVQSVPLSTQGAGLSSKKEVSSGDLSKNDVTTRAAKSIAGKNFNVNLRVVEGNVKAEDGSPLPGVNVVLKGTNQGTVTDTNGYFKLDVTNHSEPILFSFIGMTSEEIAPQNRNNLQVTLKEDASQLSEVVVTGLSLNDRQNENPVVINAAPVGGIKAYNKYLETDLRYPQQALDNKIKGKVTVSFTITEAGLLSDFIILKGLGYGCDDEVIRLVKEGPKWSPTTINRSPVETEVKVKVRFDPDKAKR